MKKATLKELAKELGVSISTVSKALSDSPEISEFTKIKIKEFAQLKNYKPNTLAKNLKYQRTFTIGVVLPNILNPFFAKVFSGIEAYANSQGYNLITCMSNESIEKEKQVLDILDNGSIDGFIMSMSQETQKTGNIDHLRNIIKSGTPIVLFDRNADDIRCDKVLVDDYESACNATEYLIKTKAKKIALLSTINNLSVGELRTKGYLDTLLKNNISVDPNLILSTDNEADFDAKMESIFAEKPDAFFALDEHASVNAHKLSLQKGFKIPEEIQIIGFADGVWSKRLTPSLSTVSQHAPEIGAKAAELMIKRIETPNNPEEEKVFYKEVIKTELRKRESVRKI